ncbi:hypothetical protein HYR99_17155 [Candidatus Poribacteria bacterium]|nr:hypothetical protein [Candidatus Poribacteria bacterium]
MKLQRFAIVLTVINLALLMLVLAQVRPTVAQDVAPVLRGRALEIVDEQGKVRAQIIVEPATTMPDGKTYPDTVLLRLIDPNLRPAVKLGASEEGSGLVLAGDSERREWSGVQILAKGTGSLLKLVNKDGREQLVKP